ncbi:hypothetical protein ACFE04_020355 [Oxalis oulophora]
MVGDNGYGNAMNVKRTVRGYITASFAGIILVATRTIILISASHFSLPISLFGLFLKIYSSASNTGYTIEHKAQDNSEHISETSQEPVFEVTTPSIYKKYGVDGSRIHFLGIWSRTLSVKITGRDGFEKLGLRIPISKLQSFYFNTLF